MNAEDRPYITCRELLDFLGLYLDNELPEERRSEFDRHLAVCPPCRQYVRQYEISVRLGREAFKSSDAPAPEDTPEELVRAVLQIRRR